MNTSASLVVLEIDAREAVSALHRAARLIDQVELMVKVIQERSRQGKADEVEKLASLTIDQCQFWSAFVNEQANEAAENFGSSLVTGSSTAVKGGKP